MVSLIFIILSNLLGFSGFMIDTTIHYGPAIGKQMESAVAFDGENYLVVWQDERLGKDFDIFGARVNLSGEVLDKGGIPICIAKGIQQRPAITFDGKNFLVVWEDLRDKEIPGIYSTWVTPSGEVFDTSGFLIYRPEYEILKFLSIASSKINHLMVWQEKVGRWWKIRGTRIDSDGHPIDSVPINICNYRYDQVLPSVVFGDTNYLVVWQELSGSYSNIYAARINTSGEVLDTLGFPISHIFCHRSGMGVGFDGRNYFVVWSQRYTWKGLNYDVYGTRVSQEGVVLDIEGIPIAKKDRDELNCGITFDGSNYLLTVFKEPWWSCRRWGYYGCRINPEGEILDTFFICDTANLKGIDDISCGEMNCLLIGNLSKDGDIGGLRIGKANRVLDSIPMFISTSANEQRFPSIASDGSNYLITWSDDRRGSFNIHYLRVDPSGTPFDKSLPINEREEEQDSPFIGFDGKNYMVVWEDRRNGVDTDVYGARISPSGVILNSQAIPIAGEKSYERAPSLSFDGRNCLVVWGWGHYDRFFNIYGTRVDSWGNVVDSVILICRGGHSVESPEVTFGKENHLVVWKGWFWAPYQPLLPNILGVRVAPTGEVLDTNAIRIYISTEGWDPAVAFDGINYLVVWEDERGGIYGTRVNESGVVLDSGGKSLATPTQRYPSLLFDGENYLLVYEDSNRIWGSRITPSLEVLEEFSITSFKGERAYSSITQGIDNQYFIVYQSWTGPPYSAYRVYGAIVGIEGIKEDSKRFTSFPSLHIYPNPAKGDFSIEFTLEKTQKVELSIYDPAGRLMKRLKSGWVKEGIHKIFWNGKNKKGVQLPSGIYFIKLSTGNQSFIRKITILIN